VDNALEALSLWLAASHCEGDLIALYEARTLQFSGVDPAAAVATLRALATLAGAKGWHGRVELRGGELTAQIRIDPPTLAALPPSADKVGEAAAKALSDGLRASQQHTHALASLLIQTVQQFGQGAAAILTANERAISSLVERAERAEQFGQRTAAMLDQAIEAAEASERETRKTKQDMQDLGSLARAVAGPAIDKALAGVDLKGLAGALNGAPAPTEAS
jgi:hypothetical protein